MDCRVSFINQFTEKKYDYDFFLSPKEENTTVFSPGLTSVISLIPSWINSIKKFFTSLRHNDTEQTIEYLVISFNLPLGIASALERLIALIMLIMAGISYVALTTQALILALIFMVIELGLEVSRLIRNLCFDSNYHISIIQSLLSAIDTATDISQFIKEHHSDLELCLSKESVKAFSSLSSSAEAMKNAIKEALLDNTFERIHKHYLTFTDEDAAKALQHPPDHPTLSELRQSQSSRAHKLPPSEQELLLEDHVKSRMQTKLNAFARRIRPWGVHHFYLVMRNYKNVDLDNKQKLFSMIHTQLDKTQLIHIVGIIAISLSTISIIFSMVFFPFIIPLSIGIAGILIEFSRHFAPNAFLDQKGWSWDWKACLPFDTKARRTLPQEEASPGIELMEIKPITADNTENGPLSIPLDSRAHTPTLLL